MDKLDTHAMIKRILYEGGQTPEGVYEIALNIVKTENEQKQKKEIEKKRKAMLDAFKDYLDAVDDAPTSDEFMKKIENEFIEIERGANPKKKESKQEQNKKRRKNTYEEDPEFIEFMRKMGFLDE